MFSDLESDYINPIDLCNKLNQVSSVFLQEPPLESVGVVCPSRVRRTRVPSSMFPIIRAMDGFTPERTSFGL
jgi:hypothetical protein